MTGGRYASTIVSHEFQSALRNTPKDEQLHSRIPDNCHDCGCPLPSVVYVASRKVPFGVFTDGSGCLGRSYELVPLCEGCAKSTSSLPHWYASRSCEVCDRRMHHTYIRGGACSTSRSLKK
jgi:hypothetical protein